MFFLHLFFPLLYRCLFHWFTCFFWRFLLLGWWFFLHDRHFHNWLHWHMLHRHFSFYFDRLGMILFFNRWQWFCCHIFIGNFYLLLLCFLFICFALLFYLFIRSRNLL